MIRRVLGGTLACGLAVLTCGLGAAGAGASTQAAGSRAAHGLPGLRVVHVHRAYLRALGHVSSGPISGVVRPAGYQPPLRALAAAPAAGAAPAACTEPNCRESYHGGPVQLHPKVYLVLWGPNWSTDTATKTFLGMFYTGLGVEPPFPADLWSEIMAQYGDKSGFPTFGQSVGVGEALDSSTPPHGATKADFASEAASIASQYQLATPLVDDQLVILTQSGTCPKGFPGSMCGSNPGNVCAWHSYISSGAYKGLTFTNLPYESDAPSCSAPTFSNGTNTVYNGFTISGGREFADSLTDPTGTGWSDPNGGASGAEIADKCANVYPTTKTSDLGLVNLFAGVNTAGYVMQPLFSNRTFGTPRQSCPLQAIPDALTQGKTSYTSAVDTAVKTQIQVSSSANSPMVFSGIMNVPAGLKMSSSGLVTGTPMATGSTTELRFTVDDTRGAHEIFFVSYAVTTATGHLKGYKGLCADVSGSGTAAGTKVVIYSCFTSAQEKWTLANGGALMADGLCLSDPHSGGAGTGLVIDPCATTPTASQSWTRNAAGQYVLGLNHLCLADPNSSITAGTQLKLETCATSASQVWSIP